MTKQYEKTSKIKCISRATTPLQSFYRLTDAFWITFVKAEISGEHGSEGLPEK